METLLRGWPFLGAAVGALVLASLLARRRGDAPWSARLHDPAWLLWLPLPIYMLHQFEEHGVDLFGRRYAFQAAICAVLGHPADVAGCPASEPFLLAVNVGTVWIAGVCAGLAGPRRPMVGAATVGLLAANAAAHIAPALRSGTYNPGLLTAGLLFFPTSAWILAVLVRRCGLRPVHAAAAVGAGVLMHGVLIGSLILRDRGVIPEAVSLALQIANGFVPLAVGGFVRAPTVARA
jgi:hypothetical protein